LLAGDVGQHFGISTSFSHKYDVLVDFLIEWLFTILAKYDFGHFACSGEYT
jgi:hypothetical protein